MKKLLKITTIATSLALLSGCSGSVYNKEKNLSRTVLFCTDNT
ncbi:DUF4223 family protein [Escherichia marmotae]|nr:DUF4223 domain-containing protein [Escherichia coli]MED9342799.1 DUF4223 family protein [Escherichia marmotae]EGM8191334.1 DUF4223 domain-containing protein [Escherichia coli]EJU2553017.1 DUF4223 family protein [Escherichia coli]MEC9993135.1 DUF4223 family protein [Escherichia coli]